MDVLTQFAESSTASSDLFTALGIDWKMFVFQVIAFAVLVFLLGKFVYPSLMKVVDKRQAEIEAGSKAAEEAKKQATAAHDDVAKLMKQARRDASDIVSTAKEEAAAAIAGAEAKSKTRAERIVAEAHDQLEKDVEAARKMLHNETIDLVALATEKVVGKTITAKMDEAVITKAVKEAK